MVIANHILDFYQNLNPPSYLPKGVEVMNPYDTPDAWVCVEKFYKKYYNDEKPRTLLIGINPGRFGGGITGIPFTDPIQLAESCGINNPFEKHPELSSRFIYTMINELKGPFTFYQSFFITAVSPLGFTKDGKNLNYYDISSLETNWESFMVKTLQEQIAFCGNRKVGFSIGMGKNIKYLEKINKKYDLFDELIALPHPRWVMQYRLKRIEEFIGVYEEHLSPKMH